MPKRLELRTTAKMMGGPKDGEVLAVPGVRPAERLEFKSRFLTGMVHYYLRGPMYKAAGYEVHVYQYSGCRAPE